MSLETPVYPLLRLQQNGFYYRLYLTIRRYLPRRVYTWSGGFASEAASTR
jgi:hypothetical protein